MRAHELARQLLAGPDLPVISGGEDLDIDGRSWDEVVRVLEHDLEDGYWYSNFEVHREPALELRVK